MVLVRQIGAGVCVLLGLGAQAQVLRCTDASTGKVTYTDGACAGGANARQVQPRTAPEEIRQQREQAAQALADMQQRLDAEAARQQMLRKEQDAPAAPRLPDHARSPECTRSRRHLQAVLSGTDDASYGQSLRVDAAQRQVDLDCLGPQAYTDLEKTRAARPAAMPPPMFLFPPHHPAYPAPPVPPAPPRKPFTQCNVWRCYDSQGNSYPH